MTLKPENMCISELRVYTRVPMWGCRLSKSRECALHARPLPFSPHLSFQCLSQPAHSLDPSEVLQVHQNQLLPISCA